MRYNFIEQKCAICFPSHHMFRVYFKVWRGINIDTWHAMCQSPKNIFQAIPFGMEYG
jgi:hypothetical protein